VCLIMSNSRAPRNRILPKNIKLKIYSCFTDDKFLEEMIYIIRYFCRKTVYMEKHLDQLQQKILIKLMIHSIRKKLRLEGIALQLSESDLSDFIRKNFAKFFNPLFINQLYEKITRNWWKHMQNRQYINKEVEFKAYLMSIARDSAIALYLISPALNEADIDNSLQSIYLKKLAYFNSISNNLCNSELDKRFFLYSIKHKSPFGKTILLMMLISIVIGLITTGLGYSFTTALLTGLSFFMTFSYFMGLRRDVTPDPIKEVDALNEIHLEEHAELTRHIIQNKLLQSVKESLENEMKDEVLVKTQSVKRNNISKENNISGNHASENCDEKESFSEISTQVEKRLRNNQLEYEMKKEMKNESNDDNETEADSEFDNQGNNTVSVINGAQGKIIKPRKRWREQEALITPTELAIPTHYVNTTNQVDNLQYDILKHIVKIGKISINPDLLTRLDKDQTTTLINLCISGKVIEGDTKGQSGLIFLGKKSKKSEYPDGVKIKLKNCSENIRFFAVHDPNSEARNEFVATGFRLKHKKHQPITMVPIKLRGP